MNIVFMYGVALEQFPPDISLKHAVLAKKRALML